MIQIDKGLFLGNISQLTDVLPSLNENDVIVNCTRNLNYSTSVKVIRIAVDDDESNESFQIMYNRLLSVVLFMINEISSGKNFYVHCKMGQQRSAAVCAAYLMLKYNMKVDDAINFIKSKKPDAFFFKANFLPVLQSWSSVKLK